MILLNFSHPLTADHLSQVAALTGQTVEQVIDVPSQIDPERPLSPQVSALADRCGLTPTEWQTLLLLVNPPALNFSAAVLLAELHGRCGYFPTILRLRPMAGRLPPRYEVAEVLNLQAVREEARQRRGLAKSE